MSGSTTLYDYGTLNEGSYFEINKGQPATGSVPFEKLSVGKTFEFNGGTYTYAGGADNPSGQEIGFFAIGPEGHTKFFSTSPDSNQPQHLTENPSQTFTICFMAGTMIATPGGPVAVEDLAIGDVISTHSGGSAPVRWIGRQTVATRFANPTRSLPVRIAAGALDEQLPARDLLVSPGHAFLLDGVLVQAGALVNGTTITRETVQAESFVYYHVELDDHALLLAEGVAAETFIDDVERTVFDNWAEHEALYPQGRTVAAMDLPRACAARQVPPSVAARVAMRAEALAAGVRHAA